MLVLQIMGGCGAWMKDMGAQPPPVLGSADLDIAGPCQLQHAVEHVNADLHLRECPRCGGIKRPVAIGGPYWVSAQIDCRDQVRAHRCRPHTEPAAASRRPFATSASAAACSSCD